MRVTEVTYEGCFNLGRYENEKIKLTARLEPGERPEEVIDRLRGMAVDRSTLDPQDKDDWRNRFPRPLPPAPPPSPPLPQETGQAEEAIDVPF